MQFRKDINGLRALAVLPVIFFHSKVSGFGGGFLGVDVFFVISGFLITSSIIKNINNDNFSLLSFYDKRARRILPALILTMLLTLVFSFIFMLPYDLKNFGQSLVSTSLGANNILLYVTSGYWSFAAEFKPLYHTWSLGVEEQYYFIIPLVFMVLFKNKKILLSTIISFFIISFVASLIIESKEFNFLIILTRFWELCAGSFLAMYMKNNINFKSDVLSSIGLFLICLSYYSPNYLSNNQAIINITPVLGVLMVIAFTKQEGRIYKILSQKLVMIIGLTSYSIYLFHQPLLAFLRLSTEGEVDIYKQLLISLMSLPLGYLSWKYVESPFRNKKIIPNKLFYSLASLFIVSFVSTGIFLHKSYGMHKFDIFSKYSYGINPQIYADRAYSLAKNKFSSKNKKMLIIGDSFGRDFYNALEENKATNGYEVIYIFNYFENKELSRRLLGSTDITIWVSSSGKANQEIHHGMLKTAAITNKKELQEFSNGEYFYVGTKNYGFNNNFVKQLNWDTSKDHMVDINKSIIEADKIEREVFSDRYISLLDLFRVGNKTRIFTNKHRFISFDTDHVTKDGAVYLGDKVLRATALKSIKL